MALDTRIPLMVQPVQLPDFNAMAQTRLQNTQNIMAMRQQQQGMQEQQAIRQVYSQAVNPQTGEVDFAKLKMGLAPIKPQLIPEIDKYQAEHEEQRRKQTEFGQKQLGSQFQVAMSNPDDATMEGVKANLIKFGMPADALDAELAPIMALPVEQRSKAIFNRLAADKDTRAALEFTMPKPEEVNLGGSVVFLDMNPNSPTFKKPLSEHQVTMTEYQRRELAQSAASQAETARHNRVSEAYQGQTNARENIKTARELQYGPPLTETQGKAQTFARRMVEAQNVLNDLEMNKGVTNTGLVRNAIGGTLGVIPLVGEKLDEATGNVFNAAPRALGGLNEGQQQTEQARRNFVNAVLRRESGASISPSEFNNAAKQYFPQPGDSAAVVSQKRRNREIAIEGMRTEAGPGAGYIPAIKATGGKAKSNGVDKKNPLLSGG